MSVTVAETFDTVEQLAEVATRASVTDMVDLIGCLR
jgi:hypothetical protein